MQNPPRITDQIWIHGHLCKVVSVIPRPPSFIVRAEHPDGKVRGHWLAKCQEFTGSRAPTTAAA